MRIVSLNCRVWTRDTDRRSPRHWRKRMERIRRFIADEAPDVLCLQELSFPANLWIPKGYRRVGLSASHHIYVRMGIKARPLWFAIHHNAAEVEGVRVINVHGTWRKCMGKVWERLRREADKRPCLMAGDFNHSTEAVAERLGKEVEDIGDITFRHNFTGSPGSLDHCAAFGLSVVSCGVVNDGFMMSDHLPLVIEIKRQT